MITPIPLIIFCVLPAWLLVLSMNLSILNRISWKLLINSLRSLSISVSLINLIG